MKKNYHLAVTQQGKTEYFHLNNKKPLKFKSKANTKYKIYDDEGNLIHDVRLDVIGDDVQVYLPNEQEMALVLENYQNYATISNMSELVGLNATLATTTPIASGMGLGAIASGIGAIGLGASAIGSRAGNKNSPIKPNNADNIAKEKAEQDAKELAKNPPKISFDNVTDDNIINQNESQTTLTITGKVANSKTGDVLSITIGTASQTVVITDGKFSLNLDGKTLVVHNQILASLTRNGKEIGKEIHTYQVDTDIDTPKINFNDITDDNVINLKESEGKINVSGRVDNAKDGDEIMLSCGCPTCTGVEWVDIKATIKNGAFSVNFDGSEMVGNGRTVVKASLTTKDDAGNSATGTAEKSYDVDITPPDPSFVYEKIGRDSVINAKTAENDIILRGKVVNLGDNETLAVKIVVNGKDYVATKNGDYYQVSVASSEFANGQDITWHLTAKDKAGNEKIIEQNQSYTYDVALNAPTVEIANNNQTVNIAKKGLTLSGNLNFDDDVVKSSVKVEVLLNGQTYLATVNPNTKTWTLDLAENIAKAVQGDNNYTVKVSVQDKAGNTAENQSIGKFLVDTIAPQITVKLNDIGEIAQNGTEKIALTGTVTGEFKANDKVKILVNGTEFTAPILATSTAPNGTFSVEVPRISLIQNASQKISASIESIDDVGNVGMHSNEQSYNVGSVVTPPSTPITAKTIMFDTLTSDNLINVTESKAQATTISGKVDGANGQTISLQIGDKTHSVKVENGKFSTQINTQELIQNASGKIVASMGSQTTELGYVVGDFATSQLQITSIGENFTVLAPSDTVKFTGKVDLTGGLFGKWGNASLIDSIQATLNDKTYLVALNADKTFTLNIPLSDVKKADGQGFTFSLPDRFTLHDVKMGAYNDSPMRHHTETARLNEQSKYQLDANPWLNHGKVVTPPESLTNIAGVVTGKANVGDTVIIKVGDKTHETKVAQGNKGLIFALEIPTAELLNTPNESITATLTGKNWQNQNYEISVKANYEIGNAGEKFVITHPLADTTDIATDPRAPYFIQALAYSSTVDHLLQYPVGHTETAELTYRFKPTAGSETVFNETNQTATRNALKMFEKYANLKFTEVGENEKADIGYIMSDGDSRNGFADYGGDVWLNGAKYQSGGLDLTSRKGYMTVVHETLHSLGAKHPFEGRATFPSEENDKMVSFMNYNNKLNDAGLELPMFDLAYLHYRYGVNKTARTENNTYGFKSFNPNVVDGDVYIWDGGGVDTFDASDQTQGVTVNLTAGSWVHSGAKSDNFLVESVKNWNPENFFDNKRWGRDLSDVGLEIKTPTYSKGQAFIGYGTQIERLIGSKFDDNLKGNVADNDIYGNDGKDTIFGDAGNDYIDGGTGADNLLGGLGDDIFVVDDANDTVFEKVNEGTDTVYAHTDFTLSDNVENLTLFGTASKGVGNSLDNRITGNGQANTLTGGAGKDTFVFNDVLDGNVDTINDFTVGEDKIELNPSVFVGLTAENLAERIQYDSKTGHLTYDPDGAGKADVIHFATLQPNLNLPIDNNHFILSNTGTNTPIMPTVTPPVITPITSVSPPVTPTTPPTPPKGTSVHLNSITSDDVINVTESKTTKTKITGTAENANGQMVTVQIGNDKHNVKVENGTFSLDVDTKTLVENQGGKVSASLNGQASERAYKVDNFASTQIKINDMVEINPSNMVRLTGKITLDGLFAKYQNPIQLQSFVAKLNGKEYAVAVNTKDQSFSWDISLADLQNAKGQEISFVNKGGISLYDYQHGEVVFQGTPQLATNAYQFNNNPYVANGAVKQDFALNQTEIKGQVSGSAKAGDTVEISIGKEIVRTEVQKDLSFAVTVEDGVLKQADKLTATLIGKNYQGQKISVQTEHAYETGTGKAKGEFVSKFVTPSENELPYFIKVVETIHKDFGYLKRFEYGQGAEITYSFNKEYYQARDWTHTNRKAVRDALANYAKYADLKFVELPDNSGVNVPNGVGRADIEFHHRPLTKAAGTAEFGGNVNISTSHNYMDNRNGFHVVMHEIGHSLGMKHTHETPNPLSYTEDSTGLSVMSYKGTQMDVNRWDLRIFDIAFVQYRYGVNKNERTGDDVYTFKAFNTQVADGDVYIWDGAGVDTFDASKEKERVTVDLTPGSWIYRGEKTQNFVLEKHEDLSAQQFLGMDGFVNDPQRYLSQGKGRYTFTDGQAFIGYGTQLERLIGSDYNDNLKGNVADNEIFGGKGNDWIDGKDGNDFLDGGQGVDTIHGGKGDDIFVVDNAKDLVVENYLEGIDTVYSHAQSYTLSANVENISLFGIAEIAIGNDLNNRIVGNELSNTLTGGAGKDTFVFSNLLNGSVDTITDFNLSEDSIALALSVFDNLTKDNIKEHIKYNSQTGALSYDKDGAGIGDAVQFAIIGTGFDETQINYTII